MNFSVIRAVRSMRVKSLLNGHQIQCVSLCLKQPCVTFNTSTSCNEISSQESFDLRHQVSSLKKSNTNWVAYRVGSVGLLAAVAGCFICPGNSVVDYATVTLLVHHNYFGLKSVLADYMPLFFKDGFTNLVVVMWLITSIITLGLLYAFNYNNIGFSKAVNNFFKL
uniref:Succinate dehydrogenase [ubiquinone] cytochrome b small subunit n=1 Tax=Ciona savignyi TaxID=51511 RepID=H2YQV3_CIOSA